MASNSLRGALTPPGPMNGPVGPLSPTIPLMNGNGMSGAADVRTDGSFGGPTSLGVSSGFMGGAATSSHHAMVSPVQNTAQLYSHPSSNLPVYGAPPPPSMSSGAGTNGSTMAYSPTNMPSAAISPPIPAPLALPLHLSTTISSSTPPTPLSIGTPSPNPLVGTSDNTTTSSTNPTAQSNTNSNSNIPNNATAQARLQSIILSTVEASEKRLQRFFVDQLSLFAQNISSSHETLVSGMESVISKQVKERERIEECMARMEEDMEALREDLRDVSDRVEGIAFVLDELQEADAEGEEGEGVERRDEDKIQEQEDSKTVGEGSTPIREDSKSRMEILFGDDDSEEDPIQDSVEQGLQSPLSPRTLFYLGRGPIPIRATPVNNTTTVAACFPTPAPSTAPTADLEQTPMSTTTFVAGTSSDFGTTPPTASSSSYLQPHQVHVPYLRGMSETSALTDLSDVAASLKPKVPKVPKVEKGKGKGLTPILKLTLKDQGKGVKPPLLKGGAGASLKEKMLSAIASRKRGRASHPVEGKSRKRRKSSAIVGGAGASSSVASFQFVEGKPLPPTVSAKKFKYWPEVKECDPLALQTHICCSQCELYYHVECVGIEKDQDLQSLTFVCPPCRHLGDKPRRISGRKSTPHTKGIANPACERPNCPLRNKVKRHMKEEEVEFVIEKIVGRKLAHEFWRDRSQFEYLIKWEGYSVDESTWKPEHDFQHQMLLPDFLNTALEQGLNLDDPSQYVLLTEAKLPMFMNEAAT